MIGIARKMRSNKWYSAGSRAPAEAFFYKMILIVRKMHRRLSALCRGTLISLPLVNKK
jgi:hypothetical protein